MRPVSTKSGNKNPYLRTREDGKTEVQLDKALGGVASGMNQMVSSMEQLGIDLPAGIQQAIGAVQGISSILTGIATTLLAIEALTTADVVLPFPFANGGVVHAMGGYEVPGHYGYEQVTTLNLTVVAVDVEKNAILIKGSVPGANKGLVTIRSAVKFTKSVPAAKALVDYSAKAE